MAVVKIARRSFLAATAAAAGGLAVGYYYIRNPYPNPLIWELDDGEATFNPYVKIGTDNSITVIVPRAEMGQGVSTTLAALVAEELEVGMDRIAVEHGPADWSYYNSMVTEDGAPFAFFDESLVAETMRALASPVAKFFGLQATGGSTSTRDAYDKMRIAGCAARHMLAQAAGNHWGVETSQIKVGDGLITDLVEGKTATYGTMAASAALLDAPRKVALKAPGDWRILGQPQRRIDTAPKVTGQAVYGIDIDIPDMVYGTVKMSPVFGARPLGANLDEVLAMPGVRNIVALNTQTGSGYGIIADHTWAAFKAAEALNVEWSETDDSSLDSQMITARLREAFDDEGGYRLRDDGNVDSAFADAPAEELIEAEYSAPLLAHACMEPMNATARWKNGFLEIWAPSQSPTMIQMMAAPLVGVKADAVRVHTPFLGGGFGRRSEFDFALYAVEMAKHTEGRPVKVTWTREEDMAHDMYRPPAVARMRARIQRREIPKAVEIAISSPSLLKSIVGRTFPNLSTMGPDKLVTEGAHDQPIRIGNYRVSAHMPEIGLPLGFWRSVGHSYNSFFHECFLDEIAHASGIDPLGLRLQLMGEFPAAVGVLQKVAELSGWGRDLEAGQGLGLAHTLSYGTWTAQVVQVSTQDEAIRIDKVWCVADLGLVLDPEIVRAQLMSGIVFGLSSATNQEITLSQGQVDQTNFPDFDCMRMNQCPEIEIELHATHHRMGGAGEPGVPPSIPALANAVFAATGKRLRHLPLNREIDFA